MKKQPANCALKYRLYPTRKQYQLLCQMVGNARFAWNIMLETQIMYYECTKGYHGKGVLLPAGEALKQLNELKKTEEFSFLKVNPARCFDFVKQNLDAAWRNFFKRYQEDTGKPKFKGRNGDQSFQIDRTYKIDFHTGFLKIRNEFIPFEINRKDKVYAILLAGGYEKTITVTKVPSGKFYISIQLFDPDKVESPSPPEKKLAIGIDLGINELAILSDGTKFENLKTYKRFKKKLARLQQKASRQYLMNKKSNLKWRDSATANWKKTQQKVRKTHERIKFIRKDYTHEVTNYLTDKYDVICIEDLAVKNMTRRAKKKKRENGKGYEQNGQKRKSGLNRNLLDANFGEFVRQLEYKAAWKGKQVVKVPRFFASSKTCSSCGWVKNDLTLKDRSWTCAECGEKHDRDINAAINILYKGLEKLYGDRSLSAEAAKNAKAYGEDQGILYEVGNHTTKTLTLSSLKRAECSTSDRRQKGAKTIRC